MTNPIRDDLDDWLTDYDYDEDPALQPDALDPTKANGLLRRLRTLERRRQADVDVAAAEKAAIDGWLASRTDPVDTEIGRLANVLEGYMRARHAVDAKVKTLNLPNGTLRLRPTRNRVIVEDREAFTKWALERTLRDSFGDNVPGAVVAFVAALQEATMLSVKIEPSTSGIGKEVVEGTADVDADGVRRATPIIGTAEIVPGVSLQRLDADSFTVTPTDPADATPPPYGDETTPDPRENQ